MFQLSLLFDIYHNVDELNAQNLCTLGSFGSKILSVRQLEEDRRPLKLEPPFSGPHCG